jgi:hypothetical protein
VIGYVQLTFTRDLDITQINSRAPVSHQNDCFSPNSNLFHLFLVSGEAKVGKGYRGSDGCNKILHRRSTGLLKKEDT